MNEAPLSWGRHFRPEQKTYRIHWPHDDIPFNKLAPHVLPYGFGRSYGDSCLNAGGILLLTEGLNRFSLFDPEAGTLRCEAGVSLADILRLIIPHGWFLPVVPGTQYVSLGGAIANDIHGKNHHREGTFGRHVKRFLLLRSDGSRIECSEHENTELYQATIGGLGLTGLILWAEIRLKPITSSAIDVETVKFESFEEFFDLADASDQTHEYTVAWADLLDSPGRGLFMRGHHAEHEGGLRTVSRKPMVHLPFEMPDFLLNRAGMKTFNRLYFERQKSKKTRRHVDYGSFFFPLDAVGSWNRLYGRRGFFQYQCVVSPENRLDTLRRILKIIQESGNAVYLAVIKNFGDLPSPGMLSFPRKGVTLALDFSNRGKKTTEMLTALDQMVIANEGAVYPAKDARMPEESFKRFFPQWGNFSRFTDPRFSSSFWRRVTNSRGKSNA